ncbi:Na+/H+ antiporter subunit D [Pontivivens insulae]|uniref:Na(+)/H(+) antiporter subunit D n=1 Tax=Pontivivens insulae TaxID=1639689 RepID=A0A2R8A655_9RHOB|nr:Na+/H+ antiporter subunit D [Pontivivens insulae]RED17837.1 multisubunit sodium/proton antiporter MrpD subunit [Pontivivens insulae]SPF27727.1 Na(+)/H(+) antiporter subunit D [Pontivivens insulae]
MILVWPVIIPLAAATLLLLLRKWDGLVRWGSVAFAVALLFAGVVLLDTVLRDGPVAAQLGGWAAPFGITLVADLLSAAMVLITGIVAVAVTIYGLTEIDRTEGWHGHHALVHALLAGVCGAFLTGDIFNLYVWFEVMLIASFGLLVVGGTKKQADGAVKYVGLNLIATLAFLSGVGLLYGIAGTLNMADLGLRLEGRQEETAVLVSAVLLLFAFGAKAAMFPVFFWLPASYHTPSVTTSALFSALLTKVGVYALIRVFTLIYDLDVPLIQSILLYGAILTMVVGVLGAAAQNHFRRILSFHIISQIGYMVLGLALATPAAMLGAIFYLFHHIIVKANLFLIAGAARRMTGSEELKLTGGLYAARPLLAVLFLIPAFSLAGIPPLSGFWAKFLIVDAGLQLRDWLSVIAALGVGLLTIYSMSKIWLEVFWKPHPDGPDAVMGKVPLPMLLPIIALAILTLVIGLAAGIFVDAALVATEQILNPEAYIEAVLGAN